MRCVRTHGSTRSTMIFNDARLCRFASLDDRRLANSGGRALRAATAPFFGWDLAPAEGGCPEARPRTALCLNSDGRGRAGGRGETAVSGEISLYGRGFGVCCRQRWVARYPPLPQIYSGLF